MYALNNLETIEQIEASNEDPHVIILLFVKVSDRLSNEIMTQLNYYHYLSQSQCSIYCAGFMMEEQIGNYKDAREAISVAGTSWFYSDACFVEVVEALEKRLKWEYIGEPQVLILQSSNGKKSSLDFRNYVSLDLAEGIRKGYIDSIPRLMTSLIKASRKEVDALSVIHEVRRRISIRDVVETAMGYTGKLPNAIHTILKDRLFYLTSIKREVEDVAHEHR